MNSNNLFLQLNKEELNLIRFYGGFDRVIFSLENQIEERKNKKIGDWKQCLDIDKRHLKIIKSVELRMNKILYSEDFNKEEE
jgi:hypothetical protein|tara:strand:+ start:261 stop:506 length:246 start_codon:yes stop_codon:yes gene_type:complete